MSKTHEVKKINQIITNDSLRNRTDGTDGKADVRIDTPEPVEKKAVEVD